MSLHGSHSLSYLLTHSLTDSLYSMFFLYRSQVSIFVALKISLRYVSLEMSLSRYVSLEIFLHWTRHLQVIGFIKRHDVWKRLGNSAKAMGRRTKAANAAKRRRF